MPLPPRAAVRRRSLRSLAVSGNQLESATDREERILGLHRNWSAFAADLRLRSEVATATGVAVLPVELVSFEAVQDDDAVVLQWATASETNNAGFDVEQQAEGGVWDRVGFVEGAGTTAAPQRYTLRVDGLAPGTYRFRVNGQVKVLESYLAPADFTIGDVTVHKGTWLLAVGWSIGQRRAR